MKNSPVISLMPTLGLCNRMQVIDSALKLANIYNVPLDIYWVKDGGMTHRFDELFKPIENSRVRLIESEAEPTLFEKGQISNLFRPSIYRMVHSYRFYRKKRKILRTNFSSLKPTRNIAIKTCHKLHPSKGAYKIFAPVDSVNQRVEEIRSLFGANTIGVHVRRTDHKKAIAHSPDSAFYKAMDRELANDPSAQFYLATDCNETRNLFVKKYGSRILSPANKATRQTLEGLHAAMVDLYCLAGTRVVYGSYWSTFSETASELGDIELIICHNGASMPEKPNRPSNTQIDP